MNGFIAGEFIMSSEMPAYLVRSAHLCQLEAEPIHIMREVVAEMRNPVMLYSIIRTTSQIGRRQFATAKLK
jgi:sulfate adenylyltransferase subunit 2